MPFSGGTLRIQDPFFHMMADGVREMLVHQDAETFLRWMRQEGPRRHPGVFAGLLNVEHWAPFATTLGVGLWNAMPLPRLGFRTEPVQPPPLGAPCWCRSGEPYSECCAQRPGPPPLGSDVLWETLIPLVEADDLLAAARSGEMPIHLHVGVVDERLQAGDAHEAMALLDPVFDDPGGFEERAEEWVEPLLDLFDALCSVLALTDRHREVFERLLRSGSPQLQAFLLERSE